MKQTKQHDIISGNVWDTYLDTSQDAVAGRLPSLGQRCTYEDGREFIFCSTLVDVVAGTVMGSPIAFAELAGGFVTAAGVSAAQAKGSTTIYVLHTSIFDSVVADQFAGGFITITESSGLRTTYGIIGNSKFADAAYGTDTIALDLECPTRAAIAAADDCVIIPPRYTNVIVNTAGSNPVGVAQTAIAPATDADATTGYLWLQTKGVGGVIVTTVANVGDDGSLLMASTNTVVVSDGTLPPIGTLLALADVTDGDVAPVEFCIR